MLICGKRLKTSIGFDASSSKRHSGTLITFNGKREDLLQRQFYPISWDSNRINEGTAQYKGFEFAIGYDKPSGK
jgi:hypothetical protein